jgi:hypothetical protein
MQSVAVELDEEDVEPLTGEKTSSSSLLEIGHRLCVQGS